MNDQQDRKSKPGPEEERLKIEGDWEESVKRAMQKKRPEDGWPDSDDAARAEPDDKSD